MPKSSVINKVEPPVSEEAMTVGVDPLSLDVVINHFKLKSDSEGNGYIAFTPNQARSLAFVLLNQAEVAQVLANQVMFSQNLEEFRARQSRVTQSLLEAKSVNFLEMAKENDKG